MQDRWQVHRAPLPILPIFAQEETGAKRRRAYQRVRNNFCSWICTHGTFATAFPHYSVFYDGFFINHAHDDYLELLLETGSAGFGVGVWFIVVLYREGLRNLRPARISPAALVSAAALAGCTGLLAHSFTDFNLHIPANAALFYVLCTVATVPGSRNGGRTHSYLGKNGGA